MSNALVHADYSSGALVNAVFDEVQGSLVVTNPGQPPAGIMEMLSDGAAPPSEPVNPHLASLLAILSVNERSGRGGRAVARFRERFGAERLTYRFVGSSTRAELQFPSELRGVARATSFIDLRRPSEDLQLSAELPSRAGAARTSEGRSRGDGQSYESELPSPKDTALQAASSVPAELPSVEPEPVPESSPRFSPR